MQTLLRDLRYAVRLLAKSPGFTAVAVIALALGIGANSAIFSTVNAVLLRPLPYKDPDRLVEVWEHRPLQNRDRTVVSPAEFIAWREQSQSFEHISAVNYVLHNLTGTAEPEQIQSAQVSASFFPMLGVEPFRGRAFLEEEDRPDHNRVVVISYGLWQRRFGGDPDLIDQQITLDGNRFNVVGIMPRGFQFPPLVEIWEPIALPPEARNNRGNHSFEIFAKLRPGLSIEQAQAEMTGIASGLEQANPEASTGHGVRLVGLHEQIVGDSRVVLLVLLAAVAFVLMIACANVANLLLARAASRHKEMAIRTALGASRWRIVRQLLVESLLLACMGGALGLLLAWWGIDVLVALSPTGTPRLDEIRLDGTVLGFTLFISLATGVLFGLVPALESSRPNLNEVMKEGGRGSTEGARRNRVRNVLVVAEVALTLVLMVGAGLMLKSFYRLSQVEPGYNPSNLLTMEITLPNAKYPQQAQVLNFYDQLISRVATVPGVQAAAVVDVLPLSGSNSSSTVTIEGQPPAPLGERPNANRRIVTPNYFRAMEMDVLEGRAFTPNDTEQSSRVVIINETMARRFWPGQDVLGKRFKFGAPERNNNPWLEIVGVVRNIKHTSLDEEARPETYLPNTQSPSRGMTLVARTANDPLDMASVLRGQVLEVDQDQPVGSVASMEQLVDRSLASRRFSMLLLGIFAAVAVILAAVGIYGVISYSVAQRTHEIGIRMALGAQTADVLKQIVGKGMTLVLIGVGLGIAVAIGLNNLISRMLYEVSPTDAMTYVVISVMLAGVALVACFVPARRAAKVDPLVALKHE
jgi:putative ABC transport system permease protein